MKIFSLLILSSLTLTFADDSIPYEKDIRVFENILMTTLELDNNSRYFSSQQDEPVRGIYLKNQGLLIEIDTLFASNKASHFRTFHIEAPDFPMGFEAPDMPFSPEVEDEMEAMILKSREHIEQALEAQRTEQEWIEEEEGYIREELHEQMQKAREEKREAIRQLKQEMNKLKKQIRNKEFNEKKMAEMLAMKSRQASSAMNEFHARIQGFEKKHKENWAEESKRIKETIIDALCQYGPTIRTVKSEEYFTLILKRFGVNEKGKRHDRIYVFPYQSVLDCRNGKMTQDELLNSSETYTSN